MNNNQTIKIKSSCVINYYRLPKKNQTKHKKHFILKKTL
jgi:hypothetical protein